MPVVSDTSPLLNLSIIGHLDLIRAQADHVLIPSGVHDELYLDSSRPGSALLQKAVGQGWLEVRAVEALSLAQVLMHDLDRGEAEAIALALEVNASLVLLDEREGRRRAHDLGLSITGTIGILLRAYRAGVLSSLRDALDRLQDEAGFWLAPSLKERILREADDE